MHLDDEDEFIDENQVHREHTGGKKFLTWKFLYEVLILMFIPLPNYDMYITMENSPPDSNELTKYTYLLSDIMLAFMVLRIFYMIRAVMKFNIYN